jgi:two-component system, chemotaxis family, response regulator WspF
MRVAIVNDLALAREILRRLVMSVSGYSIAWTATDGREAVEKAAVDRPDVILMDLVMPVMDGVEATRRIMAASPCPILLVTSSVTGNFSKVYEAMGHGGLDAVNTPILGPGGSVLDSEGLLARLAKLARSRTTTLPSPALPPIVPLPAAPHLPPLLVLGASTGGPQALARILAELPAAFPAAILIVQHIASDFAPSLAVWLSGQTTISVRTAGPDDMPKPGVALIAASDDHLILRSNGKLAYLEEPAAYPYRPSVDVFFESLVAARAQPGTAVLLTGMGADGARGLLALRRAGWFTISQDEATSVVYGMPQAAATLGAACAILPLPEIGPTLRRNIGVTGAPGARSERPK